MRSFNSLQVLNATALRRKLLILIFIVVFGACKNQDSKSSNDKHRTEKDEVVEIEITKHWQTIASVNNSRPIARHEAAFVRLNTKFYLLGGRGIRPVSIFDTETRAWSEGSKPPIELHHFQPIVFDGKIFVIGALTGKWPSETPTEYIYIYDPSSDLWKKGSEIPKNRRRGSTGNVLYNNKIYISCGIKNGHLGDHKNWMDVYDPKNDTWEILSDAPRARDHFQAVLSDKAIYLVAGRNSKNKNPFGNTIGEVDVYDITTNTWGTLPNNLPTKRAGNAATLYEDQLYVVGGESDTQELAHNNVDILDITTKTWKKGEPLKQGRHGTGLIFFEGELFIASGCGNRGGAPELDSMEKYGK